MFGDIYLQSIGLWMVSFSFYAHDEISHWENDYCRREWRIIALPIDDATSCLHIFTGISLLLASRQHCCAWLNAPLH